MIGVLLDRGQESGRRVEREAHEGGPWEGALGGVSDGRADERADGCAYADGDCCGSEVAGWCAIGGRVRGLDDAGRYAALAFK